MRNSLHFHTVVLMIISCLMLAACAAADKSASMAFDNANSVIKAGGEKLFMTPEPTPENKQRY